ncbi:large ribosomal subunit protein mL64 [Lepisosteus oculatus]|nr:PREDICTED: growth arrest and DNA damage-inducible proteins-interacting protein 1 [Lepisosteus oculatus]
MAASVLCRRTASLWGVFRSISSQNTLTPEFTRCGSFLQVAAYNPKPLKLNLKDPYIPDRDSEKTPEWQKSEKYDRKLFARYGSASGVDAAKLWPSPEKLKEIIAEEQEWNPSLQEMLNNIASREKERARILQAREKLIAANMAKMPQMVADWRRDVRTLKQKQREDKARRDRLLAEARERFGYALDPRSPKFQEMVKEIEKEEKKKKKLLKRRRKEEDARATEVSGTSEPA